MFIRSEHKNIFVVNCKDNNNPPKKWHNAKKTTYKKKKNTLKF